MSPEQKKFLKNLKINKLLILVTQISIAFSIFITWQILANLKIINTFIFSSPSLIIKTLINLFYNGQLLDHIWTTLYETILSFIIGTGLGLIIAAILWWNKFIAKIIEPFLIVINSLPKVALGPIIIIWIGANTKSIITMALLISTIISIITIYEGFKSSDEIKIKLLKSFKATKNQLFIKLILPNSFNIIISSLKINVSMSFIGVIMGEFLVSKKGIGYLIMYGSQVFNLNLVITGILVLCILSTIMYYMVSYFEKLFAQKQ